MMASSPSIRSILHFSLFVVYGYSIYWQEVHMRSIQLRPGGKYAGNWKYLTFWNLVITFAFYSLCVLCDLMNSWNQKFLRSCSNCVKSIRDKFFHGLLFPTTMYVGVSFWILFLIDRDLILPKAMEAFYPNWLNHVSHTLIVPTVLIESILNYHKIPDRKFGLTLAYILVFGYTAWTLYIALVINYWIYPVMEVLGWPARIMMIAGGGVLFTIFYFVGVCLHQIVWPQKRVRKFQSYLSQQ